MELAKLFLEEDGSVFAFQTIQPLYAVAVECQQPQIRREAICLLAGKLRREGVCDRVIPAKICTWIMDIEEQGIVDGLVSEEFRVKKLEGWLYFG